MGVGRGWKRVSRVLVIALGTLATMVLPYVVEGQNTPIQFGSGLTGNDPSANQLPSPDQLAPQAYPEAQPTQVPDLSNDLQQSRSPAPQSGEAASVRTVRDLPSDPPTEFQRLVATSIGRLPVIYGANLFRDVPSTFAPVDRVPVTPEYTIGPGDEILIQVWGQVTLNTRATVDRTGNIYIPQAGTVRVAGLQFGKLQEYLRSKLARIFRNFNLNVNMGQLRSIQIFVVGQARRPGSYTVSSLSTLVNALFATGGPAPQGSLRHIQLKRAGDVVTEFDLYDLLQGGDKSNDVPLLPGDVIYIPPAGEQIAVMGSVNTPAIYELKSAQNATVADALKLASGATNIASNEHARIERIEDHRMRTVVDVSLDSRGLLQTLHDGDIVELSAVIDRLKNGVTLRGNLADPGRYAWRAGMRLADVFPDKNALITRDYWLKRSQLGLPTLSFLPACAHSAGVFPNDGISAALRGNRNNPVNRSSGATPYPSSGGYPANSTGQPLTQEQITQYQANQNQGNPYQANPNQSNPNQYQNLQDQPQTDQNCSDLDPPRAPAQPRQNTAQNGLPEASRSSAASTLVMSAGQFEPRNDVLLSEPDIDWSYAVIERQDADSLATSLIPFNLGRLVLDHDAAQNLELQPNDVITVFSKADIRVPQAQQTRLVHLEGEFVSSGVYSVRPGETLRDLVRRAGGFSSGAYLFGSEFTRESTRRLQQQRLNEYVDQISLQAGTSAAASAGRSVSAIDTAAAAATASQNRSLIDTLRQARASGRIVLSLRPDSMTIAELPDVSLEDGDRFIVPHVPSTVSVVGAVYNPNSFIYDLHRRLIDYLRLAGGSDREADASRTYVIRADGSVLERQQLPPLRRDSFAKIRIYPGDTILVPPKLDRGSTLRTIVDIAQIAGQFGLAIAAANVVF